MADLFKKLNTLLRAAANDVLSLPSENTNLPNPFNRKLDSDVESLRKRINEAINYEAELQNRVNVLRDEVNRLDAEADAAVKAGQEAQARHLIAQMKRSEQRLTMAEADLQAHQLVAQDLIRRVNLLEATIADARRTRSDAPSQDEVSAPLYGVMDEARRRISTIGEQLTGRVQKTESIADAVDDDQENEAAVEEEFQRRINRLSK